MALLTVSSGGVPAGNYTGVFAGLEDVPPNPDRKFDAGIRWRFTIDDGPCKGEIASRITGLRPTIKTNCGKMLSGLIGRPLRENEEIDTDNYLGRRFLLVVAAGAEGGSRVEAVFAAPESQS
jgi:hypothetical protein